MSGSSAYEFHQREIGDLKTAAVYSLAVCTDLKRLLEGIRDDQPHWAAPAIREFLDPNINKCQSDLAKVDHLIQPVGIAVNVPRRVKMRRGSDGIHYEKKFPLICELREEPVAHHAAWVVHRIFRSYFWSVWRRGNPTLIYTDDVEAATDEVVNSRWQEIRVELQPFVDYDCDGLRQAIQAESKAVMERCRQSIVGDGMWVPTKPKRTNLRVKVHADTNVVEIDGTPYPLAGSDAKKKRIVEFIQAMIDAEGAPVSATDYEIRSRDVEGQHDKIRTLLGDDAKPGSGYRIPREKLMA